MFKTLNISTSTVQTLLQQSALQLLSAQHSSPAGGPQVLNSLSGLSDLCPAELNTSSPPLSHSGMLASLGLGQNMGMGGGNGRLTLANLPGLPGLQLLPNGLVSFPALALQALNPGDARGQGLGLQA